MFTKFAIVASLGIPINDVRTFTGGLLELFVVEHFKGSSMPPLNLVRFRL